MKYDFSQSMTSIFGEPLRETAEPDSAVLTYSRVIITALLAPNPDRNETFSAKAMAWDIACRVRDNGAACELKSEEVTLVKNAVGRIYGAGVCGPVETLLEA